MEPQEPNWLDLYDEADMVDVIIKAREENIRLFYEEYERMKEDENVPR